ncbi:MAG: hypothetical protein M0D54_04690 [Hyphomonadaceae bacterium JAD_PAG50586_4]|nr:MAG: hypothetical protein M0D54_04690 [Hyphomonadaceae bacterium JAD_PAG50586_4]
MRLAVWLIVPLALLSIAFLLFQGLKGTFSTSDAGVGVCQTDGQINAHTREQLSSTTLAFLETFSRSPVEARQEMSRRGRAATVERGPMETAHASYRSLQTVGSPSISETYLLRFLNGDEYASRVPCNVLADGPTFVSRGGTSTSAVAVVTEEIVGNSERSTTVWLEREDGSWRVRAISWGLSRIAGRDGSELWVEAKQQRARHHELNAAVLYAAARDALPRNAFYQHRLVQHFERDFSGFEALALVRGEPPFAWTFSGENFQVRQVQYMGLDTGEATLMVEHAPSQWVDHVSAEAANRRIVEGLNAQYPEWRETFEAIVVRAARADSNEVWGTVFWRDSGYQAAPASD